MGVRSTYEWIFPCEIVGPGEEHDRSDNVPPKNTLFGSNVTASSGLVLEGVDNLATSGDGGVTVEVVCKERQVPPILLGESLDRRRSKGRAAVGNFE